MNAARPTKRCIGREKRRDARGERAASSFAKCSSHQEWGRAQEDATRGRPEGVTGGHPSRNSSRSAGGSECMQEMAPRLGIIKELILSLIPSPFRRFEGVGRRRLTR